MGEVEREGVCVWAKGGGLGGGGDIFLELAV